MSDPTVKQQNAAAVRRAERLANPDPDYADDEKSGYIEDLKAYRDRLHAAEQQRANYTPPSHDRLRDDL